MKLLDLRGGQGGPGNTGPLRARPLLLINKDCDN